MNRSIWKFVYWIIIGLALCGLASQLYPVLVDYFNAEIKAIPYSASIDYGEGPLLDQTLRMSKFENIYRDSISTPPYTVSNYPPIFILVQVPLAWIFGPAFWYGRLISLLGVLITALFICLTLRALTRDWIGAAAGGVLLLTIPYVQHWSLFDRIDNLALVLSWAALFVSVRYLGQASPVGNGSMSSAPRKGLDRTKQILGYRPFWLASILFVCSIYTRQTYALAAPFAAFVWLILGTRGRWLDRILQAVLLGAAVAGLTLVLFLILNLATAGGFYLNIIVANVNSFYWDTVWNYVHQIQDKLWPLMALAGLFLACEAIVGIIRLVVWLVRRARKAPRPVPAIQTQLPKLSAWALVLPYLLAAGAGSITIGKDGSNVNYLLEFSAALSLAGGAALAWAWQWKRWYVRLPIQIAVICFLAFQMTIILPWNRKDYVTYMVDRMAHLDDINQVAKIVQETPGIVLADEYMGLIPLAGKQLYFQPFEFKQFSDAKVWDQTNFMAEIMNHKFDVILWYQPRSWMDSIKARWTPAQQDMINIYYTIDEKIGDVFVMRPKK